MYAIPGCAPFTLVCQLIMPFFFFFSVDGWIQDLETLSMHLSFVLITTRFHLSFITLVQPHFTEVCRQFSIRIVIGSAEIRHEKLNCSFSRAQNEPMPLFKHLLNAHLQVWVGGEAAGLLSSPEYNASWTISKVWKVLADFSLLCLD